MAMTGTNNSKWRHLHSYITKGYQYKAAVIRSSAKITSTNKLGAKKVGKVVYITKISANGKWGRLKKKSADGRYRWISLGKVSEE